jgi:hypothetical protein
MSANLSSEGARVEFLPPGLSWEAEVLDAESGSLLFVTQGPSKLGLGTALAAAF